MLRTLLRPHPVPRSRRSALAVLPALLVALVGLLLPAAGAIAQPRVELGLAGDTPQEQAGAFGVGGVHRPGDEVGIRVTVRAGDGDFGAATNVLVQWEMPNADGDIAEIRRVVALTAGGSTTTWLYGGLPPDLDLQQTWTLRAFVYDDEAGGALGAEIGTAIIQAPAAGRIPRGTSLIGLVGRDQLGLEGYRRPQLPMASAEVMTAHEDTRVLPLDVADLPDAWPGLDSFGVIVWSEGDPSALTARQEEALRDWIAGGGHLVIVLPFAGDPWRLGDAAGGPLGDLLPSRAPRLVEDVPLSDLVPLLSKSRRLAPGFESRPLALRSFADLDGDFDAMDRGWAPIVATDDGDVVVVRRPVGHGHLSLVGLELDSPHLEAVRLGHGLADTLPQADAFWNRVLGRRAAHPTPAELGRNVDRVARSTPEQRLSDGGILADAVRMSEAAGTGLLLALVLFVGY